MDKNVKSRWVAALRSGEYKQGYGKLRNDEGAFCCLGVLCDVYDKKLWRSVDGFTLPMGIFDIDITYRQHDELTSMNDEGVPFTQIADWIEEHI